MNTTDALRITYYEGPNGSGYAITQPDGVMIEHHIATLERAAQALIEHQARLAATRSWDDAHRTVSR